MNVGGVGCGGGRERRRGAVTFWVLALVVALGLGFVVGRGIGPSPSSRDAQTRGVGGELDAWLLEGDDPVDRARRFLELLERLEPSRFEEVAERLHHRSDEWAEFEARLFIWAWSRHDPVAAMAGALEWPRRLRSSVSYAAVRSWARIDPVAAQEAVRVELDDATGNLGPSLLTGLAAGWAEGGDVEGALKLVETRFSSLVHREDVTELLMTELLRSRGPEGSFAWAEAFASGESDRAFLSIVFRKLGRNAVLIDPEATVAWLDRFEGDPSYMTRARRATAVMWARADPPAALAWMLEGPSTKERRVAGLLSVLADWAAREPEEATAWLRNAPRSSDLDPGVVRVANNLLGTSPERAMVWAGLVGDERLRSDTLVQVAGKWAEADSDAASAWLEQAEFPGDSRLRIEAIIREQAAGE